MGWGGQWDRDGHHPLRNHQCGPCCVTPNKKPMSSPQDTVGSPGEPRTCRPTLMRRIWFSALHLLWVLKKHGINRSES